MQKIDLLSKRIISSFEMDKGDDLPKLAKELSDLIREGIEKNLLNTEELKRIQRLLSHLEKLGLQKREELNRQRMNFNKLKSYGDFSS
ncbi:MAG: hypothetical protein ABGX24_03680 [Aquificota bacterium]|jgi:hypothetical protein